MTAPGDRATTDPSAPSAMADARPTALPAPPDALPDAVPPPLGAPPIQVRGWFDRKRSVEPTLRDAVTV